VTFHDDCLVLDGHTDVPTRLWERPCDLTERLPDGHVDLPRLRQGGVDALVFALFVHASLAPDAGWDHAREIYRLSRLHLGPGFAVATTAEEVRRAVRRGEVAVLFGLENGRPLLVPGALAACAEMGVRYVTLTHFKSHEWCDSSTDAAAHGGLSPGGVELVREMNRRAILPDLSHVSDDAVRQVLEVSAVPPLASHSSCRALCDHPRNLPDDLIREIARRGGLVMANTYPAFVSSAAAAAFHARIETAGAELAALEAEWLADPQNHWRKVAVLLAAHPLPPASLSQFVDHVIHLVELAGEEHAGIGTDFDGIPETLADFTDVAGFPNLTAALLARGVDRAGIRLILGENFLRLLDRAERHAG
jgi:membrane dipeptidase